MIAEMFPESFQRYQSLPVLGPLMDRYAAWLREQQYTRRSARYELLMAGRAAEYLKRRSVRRLEDLTQQHLDACHRLFSRKFPAESGAVLVLACFLHEIGHAEKKLPSTTDGPAEVHVKAFMAYLAEARGFAPSTIRRQGQIAAEFLAWLRFVEAPDRLSSLTTNDLEGFIGHLSKRMGRVGLQKPIAILSAAAKNGAILAGKKGPVVRLPHGCGQRR
jgi:hypothetical protein